MDCDDRRQIALWRVAVLGPLVSARLEHGQRCALFAEAAARTHQRPDGRWVQLSARTIEAWYYAYRKGGLQALMPKRRRDRGASRAIAPQVAELIVRAKKEKPRRSIRRLIRMLERAGVPPRTAEPLRRAPPAEGQGSVGPPRTRSGRRAALLPRRARR